MQTILVTVEEGKQAGDTVAIASQDGRQFTVIIPQGLSTQYFYVDLPDSLEGGLIDASGAQAGAEDTPAEGGAAGPSRMGIMGGAAAAAGIFGMMVAGPIVAVGLAGGAAYAATRKDGVGDAARATGQASVTVGNAAYKAGKTVSSKASEIDGKYNFSGKAAKAISSAAKSVEKAFAPKDGNGNGGGDNSHPAPSAPPANF